MYTIIDEWGIIVDQLVTDYDTIMRMARSNEYQVHLMSHQRRLSPL